MGIFGKLAFKGIFKRIGLGVVDSIPVLNTIKSNIDSNEGGKSKVDWLRLGSTITISVFVTLFAMGKITIDELKELIKLFK